MTGLFDDVLAWSDRDMSGAFREREHAADIFVEIWGRDLAEVFEHGLYSLYAQLVELEGVALQEELMIHSQGEGAAETLRGLLGEALFHFEAEGFLAGAARVPLAEENRANAVLWGERLHPERHGLLTEVKAVTYHRLCAEPTDSGLWRATIIFDV
jgi:SHS2 domain-containing protein